jgi:23S rRNA (uracil1939-C5)-methyltransferase
MEGRVQVFIESMAHRGYGLTRTGGKVLFVPYSAVGDRGWVEIIESKKDYSVGKWVELTEPSPSRTTPRCPYFGVCGGCQWQHIDYSFHGELKKRILTDILKRLGGLREVPSISVAPSPRPYGYRIRVQLKIETGKIGYYQERSHRIVDVEHCPISHPLINHLITALREKILSLSRVGEVEINASPEEEKGISILHVLKGSHESLARSLLQTQPLLKGVIVKKERAAASFGDPDLNFLLSFARKEGESALNFRVSPESFFQVNPEQNRRLVEKVLELSDVTRDETVLDLYAGVGNFTLPLALDAKEAVGIEENGTAVGDACFNAERNGIRNCEFVRGRVEDVLKGWGRGKPDLVTLDPPRTGCKAILDELSALKPERIVYTSCEPATFARDIRLLSERGYRLQRLGLIDMFPQSFHMEVVGLLRP